MNTITRTPEINIGDDITLNDEKILNQPCELAPGEVFGLFHYADKTSVRVRNARLEGPWTTEVPEKLLSTNGR